MSLNVETKRFLIATVIALLGAAIPLAQWISSEKEKSLSYKIISTQKLLPNNNKSGLTVFSKDKKIENATFYQIIIKNNGSIPILRSDFDEPVTIKINENSEILYAEITSTTPSSLTGKLTIKDRSAIIEPLLLNADDLIEISLGVTNDEQPPVIQGHITGIKEISLDSTPDPAQKKKEFIIKISIFLGMPVFGFMIACLFDFTRPLTFTKRTIIGLLCIFGGETPLVVASNQLNWVKELSSLQSSILLIVLMGSGVFIKMVLFGKNKTPASPT